MKQKFYLDYKATIGADFFSKEIKKGEDIIHLQLWDTAGTEKYHSLGQGFYRNTELCVLVFDQTNLESFQNIESWRKDFLIILNPPENDKYPFVLLGNKNDMKDEIKVNQEEIDKYCQMHNNMPYFSVSAQSSLNIEEAFNKVADMAFERSNKNDEVIMPEVVPVQIEKKNQRKKKCC